MSLSDFSTVALARLHPVVVGSLINRDSLNGWLGGVGIYKRMKAIAADSSHPYSDLMEAFLDSVDYNFIVGTTTGNAHIALLDSLIANEGTIGPQLATLRPLLLSRANVVTYPFANVTEHAFQLDKGTLIRVPVRVEQGRARMTLGVDCELHNPQISQRIEFADGTVIYERVASFMRVAIAGPYSVKCPNLPNLFVDNSYDAVS